MTDRALIIGAGMGGMVAALKLASRGLEVVVLERASTCGGKMRKVAVAGTELDGGPTVLTMRWVLEEIFEDAGVTLSQHLDLSEAEVLARHAWSADERLDLYADRERSAEAIGDFAGAAEAQRYRDFCTRARYVFKTLERPFMRSPQPSLAGLFKRAGLRGLGDLTRIIPFSSLWRVLERQFQDRRLRQLFGRYSTYLGSSPWLAPATLMLVAHVEQTGVWRVAGGMHRIAEVLTELARARGAEFRFGQQVDEILVSAGRVRGVRLASGEELTAGTVVVNADVAALATGLLGNPARRAVSTAHRPTRSLSALTWLMSAKVEGFPLIRHNVFFSGDYESEFRDIFERNRLPRTPTVYVCAQDRGDPPVGKNGAAERLLCLVNAPALGDRGEPTDEDVARCGEASFRLLRHCGLEVERSENATVFAGPREFAELFPATGGALYGSASHGWRASFQRPGARSRVPGIYLAGGSAHPGPGVPMAALSGWSAASCVLEDLGAC